MLRLVVHEKGGKTLRMDFSGDQLSVGRDSENDLVLDRANVSAQHLRLRRHEGLVEALDLESTNGTYVNGRRLKEPRQVRRSDRIYVGDFILTLEGDDDAIAPAARPGYIDSQDGEEVSRTAMTLPASHSRGAALAGIEGLGVDSGVMTSAKRVAAAGLESSFLDDIADRVVETVLLNVTGLDPLHSPVASSDDRERATSLIDGMLQDMADAEELAEGVNVDAFRDRISRELLELGPLTSLMKDPEVREIQVVGGGSIRVLRDRVAGRTEVEVCDDRFSGDRALKLAVQRMARRRGFLAEGAPVLEGKVDDGFYMYALLPPTQVRTAVLSLRRNPTDAQGLNALVQEDVLSADMRELLVAAIHGCRRVLVCASGGTNLDRFMQALVAEIPEELRVACISDAGRLGSGRQGWIQVRRIPDPSDALALSDALGVVMRGGLDMLVSQRCRSADAPTVIDAMAGATRGAVVSLWGIDSAHALSRLAGMSTVASGAISALTVSLARSVDLVVRLGTGVNGEPMQVVELVEPRVEEGNQFTHLPIFKAERGADGTTNFRATGTVPMFARNTTEGAVSVPMRIFKQS